MAFINEEISKEDWEEYKINELDNRLSYAYGSSYWIINREREIWLRQYYTPRDRDNYGVETGPTEYDFYWRGYNLILKATLDKVLTDRSPTQQPTWLKCWYSIHSIQIPQQLEKDKVSILQDAIELLTKEHSVSSLEIEYKDNEVLTNQCKFIIQE